MLLAACVGSFGQRRIALANRYWNVTTITRILVIECEVILLLRNELDWPPATVCRPVIGYTRRTIDDDDGDVVDRIAA